MLPQYVGCYICSRETVLNLLVAFVPCNVNHPFHCTFCAAVFRHIHEARIHIDKTHLSPVGHGVIYPWTQEQTEAKASRDMTIFMY